MKVSSKSFLNVAVGARRATILLRRKILSEANPVKFLFFAQRSLPPSRKRRSVSNDVRLRKQTRRLDDGEETLNGTVSTSPSNGFAPSTVASKRSFSNHGFARKATEKEFQFVFGKREDRVEQEARPRIDPADDPKVVW